MRVLLTGGSSFTGLWFARALKAAGHEVTAALRGDVYADPLRAERVRRLGEAAQIVPNAPFGSKAFLSLLDQGFDVLCHHGAEAANHKSPDFDVSGAVAANTRHAGEVMRAAKRAGVTRLLFTGSVFEADEGRGSEPLRAFSPYGLSKTLSSAALAAAADHAGLEAVKVVIPNPFGPLEGQTFQRFIMIAWREGRTVHVSHPAYGRDNVPVDLLAAVYARAAEGGLGAHVSPSFYAGLTGDFFRRMQAEIAPRTGWACAADFAGSQDFAEPQTRVNLQPIAAADYGWSESGFWDGYAASYAEAR